MIALSTSRADKPERRIDPLARQHGHLVLGNDAASHLGGALHGNEIGAHDGSSGQVPARKLRPSHETLEMAVKATALQMRPGMSEHDANAFVRGEMATPGPDGHLAPRRAVAVEVEHVPVLEVNPSTREQVFGATPPSSRTRRNGARKLNVTRVEHGSLAPDGALEDTQSAKQLEDPGLLAPNPVEDPAAQANFLPDGIEARILFGEPFADGRFDGGHGLERRRRFGGDFVYATLDFELWMLGQKRYELGNSSWLRLERTGDGEPEPPRHGRVGLLFRRQDTAIDLVGLIEGEVIRAKSGRVYEIRRQVADDVGKPHLVPLGELSCAVVGDGERRRSRIGFGDDNGGDVSPSEVSGDSDRRVARADHQASTFVALSDDRLALTESLEARRQGRQIVHRMDARIVRVQLQLGQRHEEREKVREHVRADVRRHARISHDC